MNLYRSQTISDQVSRAVGCGEGFCSKLLATPVPWISHQTQIDGGQEQQHCDMRLSEQTVFYAWRLFQQEANLVLSI